MQQHLDQHIAVINQACSAAVGVALAQRQRRERAEQERALRAAGLVLSPSTLQLQARWMVCVRRHSTMVWPSHSFPPAVWATRGPVIVLYDKWV